MCPAVQMTKLRFSNLPKTTQLSAWHGLTWAGRTSEPWAWETVRQVGAQQGLQGSCKAAVHPPCLSHGAGDLGLRRRLLHLDGEHAWWSAGLGTLCGQERGWLGGRGCIPAGL